MVRCISAVLTAVAVACLAGGCSSTQYSRSSAASTSGKQATTANASNGKVAKKPQAVAGAPATKPSAQTNQKMVKVSPTNAATTRAASQANTKLASTKASKSASTTSEASGMVLGLGAGDSLGRAVYVNDVILAAKAAKRQTEFAEVQPKNDDR